MSAVTSGKVTAAESNCTCVGIPIQAVKNLHGSLAVDGAEIGASLRRPQDGDALGRRRFGHFLRPNPRSRYLANRTGDVKKLKSPLTGFRLRYGD